MEEEASRINQGQTLEENSLPSGQSGDGRHGELSLSLRGKDSKNAKKSKRKRSRDKKSSHKNGTKINTAKEGNTNCQGLLY